MAHSHQHHGLSTYVLLPQISGYGYYSYSSSDRQYGTRRTVDTLVDVSRKWMRDRPTVPIGIGDMSFEHGAPMPPHHTHHDGKEADIRPLRKDRRMLPINIHDPHYDHDATVDLVALLFANPNVWRILFNDSKIKGVIHWAGHDNHLHIKMKQ